MSRTFNFPKAVEINAISRIKSKLQINDSNEDELLSILFEDASNLICIYIGLADLPTILVWVAEEITIKRYRKIGSEGLKSEQIDVISNTFDDNPLSEYIHILEEYKTSQRKSTLRIF